jgi:hypothetical protein
MRRAKRARRARHVREKLEADAQRLTEATSRLGGDVFAFERTHLDRYERETIDRARRALHEA